MTTFRQRHPELIPGTAVRVFLCCVVLPLIVFGGIVQIIEYFR